MASCMSRFHFEKGTALPFKLEMEPDFSGSRSRLLLSTGESPRHTQWCVTVSSLGCGGGRR